MTIVGWTPRAPRTAPRVSTFMRRAGAEFWGVGHVVNISRSGLLVDTGVSIAADEPIEVIVRLSEATDTGADVWVRGRVVRLTEAGDRWQVAATIDDYRLERPDAPWPASEPVATAGC
jgi:hypothetical protein